LDRSVQSREEMTLRNNTFAREFRSSGHWGSTPARSVFELLHGTPPLVSPETLAAEAQRAAIHAGVHHVPVVSELGEPLGVVCRCALSAAPHGVTVSECMRGPAITINTTADLAQAAARVLERGVGCLPVVYDFTVVGVVTRADLVQVGALSAADAPRCSHCGSYDHVGPTKEAGDPLCRRCRQGATSADAVQNENEELPFGD
jgi:signal-transduction protein with cAMP-binding, CBS, and nucleotidyltransferase domain